MFNLLQSRILWAVLGLKIIALFFFPSYFPKNLFIPFFDQAVQHLGSNPWSLSPPHFFPYGSFLYTILIIPKALCFWIFGEAALGTGPLSLFALKLPLLLIDIGLLFALGEIANNRKKDILLLYWANPVLFYITYVYGQLDVVATALTVVAILALLKERIILSALLMAAATGSKFHVVVIIPFLMAYVWSRYFRKEALFRITNWLVIWGSLSFLAFLPLLFSGSAPNATLGSPELNRLLAAQLKLTENSTIFIGVVLTLMVVGRLVISTRISQLGLLFGAGAIYSTLVVSSHPAVGWYYWCLPFFALFFATYPAVPKSLFWSFHLLFIIIFPLKELGLLVFPQVVADVLYTALQTSLLANLIVMWLFAVRNEANVFKRARPFRIGIAGDSGSGKNTLTESLQKLLGSDQVAVIEGDNYHKWERGDEQWLKYTHLNPRANHLFALAQHFSEMSQGRPILQSTYSHETGRFTSPVEIKPSRTLIVQGLHTLYLRKMRDLFDIKIFLNPEPLIRKAWKVQRDVIQRGYDRDKVLGQLEKRESDSQRFISSQAPFADIIISHSAASDFSDSAAQKGEVPQTQIEYTVWNDLDLSPIANQLSLLGVETHLGISPDDMNRAKLTVKTPPNAITIEKLIDSLLPLTRAVTRGREAPVWMDGYNGLTQIIILWVMKASLESLEG